MKLEENKLIIGISGVTCAGKTTLAKNLQKLLSGSVTVNQDDYFLKEDDPRHHWIEELNHINYDILESLDMQQMHKDVVKTINEAKFKPQSCLTLLDEEKTIYQSIAKKIEELKITIVIIEGFSIFNYQPLVPVFNIKYFFTLDKDECFRRRLLREYDPPDCPGYFEKCAWPEHLLQLEDVQKNVQGVKFFNNVEQNVVLNEVLNDILRFLNEL